MLKKIAIVSVIFASACIDDGVEGDPGALYTDKGISPSEEATSELTARESLPDPNEAPMCAMLPQEEGACAHACDQDALLEFIPKGSCASFSCTLTDGSTFVTGGCNPD
jgi:hypothetical protein